MLDQHTGQIMFPIQDGFVRAIPWDLISSHEPQAELNHRQSLKRLAQRSGLCPSEACAVLEDRPWKSMELWLARKTLTDCVYRYMKVRTL